ncbi:thiamine pyrophosphate-binding protein [Cobetia marina]
MSPVFHSAAAPVTVRLTVAQALARHPAGQYIEQHGQEVPLFGGCFAIFGHGNVAGLGEALHAAGDDFPTYRAHNEQGMANAAIAYAKANNRRRIMACTSSIGPGATNMVTSAGLAHVNRLPVLFLPGDTFASRAPDPVLQQVEHFNDPGLSVNDCFRPVSRFFDRITRPEQLLTSLPRRWPRCWTPWIVALPPCVCHRMSRRLRLNGRKTSSPVGCITSVALPSLRKSWWQPWTHCAQPSGHC